MISKIKQVFFQAKDKANDVLEKHGVNTKPKAWWIYVLLVAMAGYGCYVVEINQYVANHYGIYLQKIYNALNHGWPNFLFFVGIVALAVILGNKIRKDKLFSWKRFLVEIFLLFVLLYQNQWDYASCILGFDYRVLLIIICMALIILEVEKYRFHKVPAPAPDRNYRKYIADDNFNPEQDYQRRETLAKEIVDRALATDISKESFSVGITGGWGTGKSTMLDNIKKSIGERAYVVEFNPWNSQTPSQIITDFFSEIRGKLSSDYRTLSKPIMRYAKLLTDVKLNPVETWVFSRLNNYAEKDLSSCKDLVAKELKKLDRPLVILIDDTDRLEGDEMFEVLRLVRNTAKLPNVIYFVAFDKSYLVGQLTQKKMPDAAQYVEKIFPLEIAMPYAEKHLLISALCYDINQMMKNDKLTNWLYRRIPYTNLMNAVEILGSYRQVKRYARLFTTEVSYMGTVFKKQELDVTDLFWLTLIQLTDHVVYEDMFRSPECYFKSERSGNNSIYLLKEGEGVYEDLDKNTKTVLEILFSKDRGGVDNSIRFCDNYYNYFYMGLEKGRVSLQEIEELMEAGDSIDKKMAELCKTKTSQSMFHRLSGYLMKQDLDGEKAYFTALTAWMNCQQHYLMVYLFKQRLTTYMIKETDRAVFVDWFIKRMEFIIKKTDNFIQIAEVLTELYPVYPSDWEEGHVTTDIIAKEDIRKLSKLTFKCFLEKYPDWDAYDMMNTQTKLGDLYKSFTIAVDYSSYDDDKSCMENLVIDEAISYFSQRKSEHYDACSKFFQLTEDEERLGYADDLIQYKEKKKIAMFGSDTKKYEEFLDKCFVHSNNQEVNQHTTDNRKDK